jgi:hypothetical protein
MIVTEFEPRASSSSGKALPPPQLTYKLYLDGREELVRGATLSEMSVRDLKDILATGREPAVYHVVVPTAGFAIPCSVVAPALLFEDVEIQKVATPQKRPPSWPRPVPAESGAGGAKPSP